MLSSLRVLARAAGWSAALCLAVPLSAEPRLLADLNRGVDPQIRRIRLFPSFDDPAAYYFAASDPAHGVELWRTDGTPAGTWRATDVCPGPCDAQLEAPQPFRGRVWFAADDGDSGSELWSSGGTPGDERPLRDFCPGPCSSDPKILGELDGRLLFALQEGGDWHLWTTDGTAGGTAELADLGEVWDFEAFAGVARVGGVLCFRFSGTQGLELWHTDGTRAGTRSFRADFGGELAVTTCVEPFDGAGYFWTRHGLWRTDGTVAGTAKVKSLAALGLPVVPRDSPPFDLAVWNGRLYSVALGQEGWLIVSDGTSAGTVRSRRLSWANGLVALPSGVILLSGADDGAALLRIDGTGEVSTLLTRPASSIESNLVRVGDFAYTLIRDEEEVDRLGLWRSDGTAAGTREVETGPEGVSLEGWIARLNGDILTTEPSYPEHTLTRRSAGGTAAVELLDIAGAPAGAGPLTQAVLGGRLVFSASTSETEAPLFSSDGETVEVIRRDASWAAGLMVADGRLFFSSEVRVSPPSSGFNALPNGIWSTDGTPEGTLRLSPVGQKIKLPLLPFGRDLFYAGDTGDQDIELWRTTGRRQGALLVKQIDLQRYKTTSWTCSPESSSPGPGIALGRRLVFAASDGLDGRELWVSDGTAAGTRQLADINPGHVPTTPDRCDTRTGQGKSSDPAGFVPFANGALFTAREGKGWRELWWTDGTAAGTRRVAHFGPWPRGSNPRSITVLDGVAYFLAVDERGGDALWRSDGTAAGTSEVHDLRVGGRPSWARELTAAGGKLFLAVYNAATGSELWVSGGTGATTARLDLRPGPAGSHPQAVTAVGDVVVFAATDGAHGLEPWRSDGTAAGTRRLADISPGAGASSPGPFTVAGESLLTGADDGVHGRELWAIPLADVLRP